LNSLEGNFVKSAGINFSKKPVERALSRRVYLIERYTRPGARRLRSPKFGCKRDSENKKRNRGIGANDGGANAIFGGTTTVINGRQRAERAGKPSTL